MSFCAPAVSRPGVPDVPLPLSAAVSALIADISSFKSKGLPARLVIWPSVPFAAVNLSAATTTIPRELYEAAALDGAGWWRRFRHVTLPMLGPTFVFVGVVTMVASFQIFSEPYVMTQGGPLKSTTTLVLFMYEQGFRWWRLGLSAAIAVILFLLTLAGTLVHLRLRRSESP